jgi:phosphocarrier protein
MKKKDISSEPTRASCQVRIVNELGLHARPAAEFVRQANSFRSESWIVTAGGRFSALSLIDVMRANLNQGAEATLEAVGPDAVETVQQLAKTIAISK